MPPMLYYMCPGTSMLHIRLHSIGRTLRSLLSMRETEMEPIESDYLSLDSDNGILVVLQQMHPEAIALRGVVVNGEGILDILSFFDNYFLIKVINTLTLLQNIKRK